MQSWPNNTSSEGCPGTFRHVKFRVVSPELDRSFSMPVSVVHVVQLMAVYVGEVPERRVVSKEAAQPSSDCRQYILAACSLTAVVFIIGSHGLLISRIREQTLHRIPITGTKRHNRHYSAITGHNTAEKDIIRLRTPVINWHGQAVLLPQRGGGRAYVTEQLHSTWQEHTAPNCVNPAPPCGTAAPNGGRTAVMSVGQQYIGQKSLVAVWQRYQPESLLAGAFLIKK